MKFDGFSKEQRDSLRGVFAMRMSDEKRAAVDVMIDRLEDRLRLIASRPKSPLTNSERAKVFEAIETHARLLKHSLTRLPEADAFIIQRMMVCAEYLRNMRTHAEIQSAFSIQTIVAVMNQLESAVSHTGWQSKPGPNVETESQILYHSIVLFRQHVGNVSISPNGRFVPFVKALAAALKIKLGTDLLRTVLADIEK